MAINKTTIDRILNYINHEDKRSWYVGIATTPKDRLFVDHNVSKENGRWIFDDALSEINARDTEKYLLQNYPFKGGTGGGISPKYIYAYKITPNTRQ